MNLLALLSAWRDWIALVLALLISATMMNSSSHPSAERFRGGISAILGVAAAPVMLIPRTVKVWGENAELRAENVRLLGERDNWRDAVLENIRLRRLLGFRDRPEFDYLAAEVIARNPALNLASLLLDKGMEDGVHVGQAVITAEGLAGVVHHAGKGSAVVQLATDRNFAASVRVERSRVDGILRWKQGETLRVDGVARNLDVKKGDRIVTSGLGGVIPGGIPVGLVTHVARSREELFLQVDVDPYVSFARLEEVFVVLPAAGEKQRGGAR